MTDLDELIRKHYMQQSLPDQRINALLAPSQPIRRRLLFGMGMGLAAGFLGAGWIFHFFGSGDPLLRISSEIALNHFKRLPVDVQTDDFTAIGSLLPQLAFTLRRPVQLEQATRLIGGRYCSIDGQLAVQLRLHSESRPAGQTLFATRVTEALRPIAGQQTTHDGLTIRYWIEDGVFFALASD